MRNDRALIMVAVFICWALCPIHAAFGENQELKTKIKPQLMRGQGLGEWTLGISYDVSYRNSLYFDKPIDTSMGEIDGIFEARLEGAWAIDEDLNNRSLVSQAKLGLSLLSIEAVVDEIERDITDEGLYPKNKDELGYFDFAAHIRHETDQSFNEQNITFGGEFGYVNIKDEGFRSFVPSIYIAYEYVYPEESDIRGDLNADDDGYSRLRVESSLKCSFGKFFPKNHLMYPFGLRLDARYYLSSGLDDRLDDMDLDDVFYSACALTYTHEKNLGKFDWSKRKTYFIKVSDGHIPPNTEDETIITIGVIFPWDKKIK